jgi:polyhydroxyalkanoate synthase
MTPYRGLNPYTAADWLSRLLGEHLDAAGLGRQETLYECVYTEDEMSLRRYTPQRAFEGPILLIVPAPIKGAYIWDAAPSISVVQRLIEGDCRVYLVEWARPDSYSRALGLDDYADRLLLKCLDVVQAETGERSVFLAGHSLGGTFAALYAALHPQRVKGLVLIGTPLHFGTHVGPLDRLVAASPRAQVLTVAMDAVPGSLLDVLASVAAPGSFVWFRWMDWLNSLSAPEVLRSYLIVARWILDEVPLARRLFEEVVEFLYRENRFMDGCLEIGGQKAAPDQVVAPLLTVPDKHCNVVPPEAVLPFHRAARSPDKTLLWYPGDAGVALRHVGALVGRNAHRVLWPQIIRWIHAHHRTAA